MKRDQDDTNEWAWAFGGGEDPDPWYVDAYWITRGYLRDAWFRLRYAWHVLRDGWYRSETWNLDVTFASFAAPRLRYLAEHSHGHPPKLTADEWDAKLKRMAWAFEMIADPEFDLWDHYVVETGQPDDEFQEIKAALQDFADFYFHLWD